MMRFSVFFELSSVIYYLVPVFGSLTSFYGGLCAANQSDIKRILAYSTISHCGFLMVSFSTFLIDYTLFYLYVHGFFKAGVFLCVGNIIRFSQGYQDFRRMGGLYKYLPVEACISAVGLFNLAGLPFSLGFIMKHLLFVALGDFIYLSCLVYVLSFLGALTGLFYGLRLIYFMFFDFKKARKYIFSSTQFKLNASKFYTNTTLGSTLAIVGLFIVAYFILFYFYAAIKDDHFSFNDVFAANNSQSYELFHAGLNFQ